eukprot:TCONS_00044144-protein
MPDIESLMQEWPPEFEEILKRTNLPSAELDCDLSEYVDVICSILDIPVYKDRIQSLHVLFTLYSEFKNSQVSLFSLHLNWRFLINFLFFLATLYFAILSLCIGGYRGRR